MASEMRLVEEIPVAILRRFAIDCARNCLEHARDRAELEALLDAPEAEIAKKRAELLSALNPNVGAAGGRAVAAAVAAFAPHPAAWAGAAAASGFAAQTAAEAGTPARNAADAVASAFDAVAALAAVEAADLAASAARVASAAAGAAHAATVAAAHDVPIGETADPYAASRVPRPLHPAYEAQSRRLLQLIAEG